ncbi:MAG: 6-hydroxycyclohex-1-ene-1-carbonyl-CoA dehydrogenase [Thermoanaerobaculia bacterium]|nr:6-hydroxycyclohex-1-ene-1-carbonyl-CoA dehydrogenase [Thermoanaerobaculia bacterium]
MTRQIQGWQMVAPKQPMESYHRSFDTDSLPPDRVLVEVAGCGVCHTDLGFLYEDVPTRHALPLTLGHEISGRVVETGERARSWLGRAVVVPAVIPCGSCPDCRSRRGAICGQQFFPGNDDNGGFASHVVVPSQGLCPVDEASLAKSGLELASLAVVADAVTTPYQAILNSGLDRGDVAVFVGVGGVGTFGVQLATAMGAHVAAIDVDRERLDRVEDFTELTLEATLGQRAIKQALRAWVREAGYAATRWKIFETSGHPEGQSLAFSLINHGAHLGVVGYTRQRIEVRLGNLMAFDATARGTWGCLPEHYPAVVERVLSGQVIVSPFVEQYNLDQINDVFEAVRRHELRSRPILIPGPPAG